MKQSWTKNKRQWAIEAISFLFILLFAYAALNKVVDFQKFIIQIGQSPLLTGLGTWVASLVIVSEFLVCGLLIFTRTRLVGFFAAFSLMVMFSAYIIAILNFSSFVPCSCGGVLEDLGWTEHLIFNLCFVILGLVGIVLQAGEINLARATRISVS